MAKKNSAQIWAEYIIVASFVGSLSLLPLRMTLSVGEFIGRLCMRTLKRLRGVGETNLRIAFPELSDRERGSLLREEFENLGRMIAAVSKASRMSPDQLLRLIEPPVERPERRSFRESGRGRIILTGHIGNWELLGPVFPVFLEPFHILARRMDNPKIEAMVMRLRTQNGNSQIDKMNSASSIVKVLRGGGAMAILADINTHPKEGIFVPFFGVPACTTTGVAMISIRTNSVLLPTFIVWDKEIGRYRLVQGDAVEPSVTGDLKADIRRTTEIFTGVYENIIRQFPGQWLWIHRRWKTRPEGESEIY